MTNTTEKRAPVQGYPGGIPWAIHLEAYEVYCKRWGAQPALIDLEGRNCRGGFSTGELDDFIPGWRDRVAEFGLLKSKVAEQAARLDDYATEINRLRNVIQAACLGGTDLMIERWKELFPDAPVPTVKQADAPASYRRDYPTSGAVLGGEHDKAKEDLRLYGVGFCVNGWHVPADKVSCWGMERASELSAAARDVVQERRRQVYAEGWTPEHDDEHADGSMALAAGCYALHHDDQGLKGAPAWWPWHAGWWKPADPRRNLVKAGALILAEIERLDRAAVR